MMGKKNRNRGFETGEVERDIDAFIGEGTSLTGNFSFTGVVRVDGTLSGEVRCEGTMILGETGVLKANMWTREAVLRGKVEGDIEAEDTIDLRYPCVVDGNIKTRNLVVEQGVVLRGKVESGKLTESEE
jgi:cytoskeletal protein CcmA (bactofilin family)